MTWNYRIVALKTDEGMQYGMHEVYYDDNGVPIFYTENPVACIAEDLSGFFKEFDHMLVALSKPVLVEEDFSGEIERLS